VARLWRIYRTFFTSSLVREMEFRANFIAKILQNMAWVFFYILIILVIYSNAKLVAGWNRGEAFVLASVVFLISAFCGAFFFSLYEVPNQVRLGTLDFVITRPVDSQFWVSLRRFNFDRLGSLVAAIGMLTYGLATSGLPHPGPGQWLAFAAAVVGAIGLYYSFIFLLMTMAIYFVRVDNLWVLGETTLEMARFPIDIYKPGLQTLLTFVLPLALLSTIPSRQLVIGADWRMIVFTLGYAAAALAATRWFWNFSLRRYTSASS
jgi:ABC-2 type transport system permease protein